MGSYFFQNPTVFEIFQAQLKISACDLSAVFVPLGSSGRVYPLFKKAPWIMREPRFSIW